MFHPLRLLALVPLAAAAGDPAPIHFSRDIAPILSENCFHCHGPDEKARKAKLRLDTREGATREHEGIIPIVPGKSASSDVIARIFSDDPDEVMPTPKSNRKLTSEQKELLRRWVDAGAPWGKHWAFEPPRRPEMPVLKDAQWSRNPVDRFILERLERESLAPAPEADKATLLRRVALDLTGLPPTPAELDAFGADAAPNAYDTAVDRLLASPRYGERMAWEWLDAARYADTNGYQGDNTRAMYPWRDWAVKALNDNMPYDQFTIWQLAGDLLPNATDDQKLATAFVRNHPINGEGGRIAEENRIEYLFDQTETVGTVWLGLTVGCCRCHDHKFDAITQKEYFSLLAFFNNTPVDGGGGNGQTKPVLDMASPEHVASLKVVDEKVKTISAEVEQYEADLYPREAGKPLPESAAAKDFPGGLITYFNKPPKERPIDRLIEAALYFKERNAPYAAQLDRMKAVLEERRDNAGKIPRVMIMAERPDAKPRDTFVLDRGAYDKPGAKIEPGVPGSLPPLPAPDSAGRANRLALARWLVSPENPLTARVTVNRAWQLFFGTGLVKTVDDFGVQAEKPSHPELLDWLACEFMHSGWNVKALHRLIVTSAAYRQSARVTPEVRERDPENRLLTRGPRFRLPSWMLRDQALAMSGLLVEKVGGLPVKGYQPPGIWEEATFGQIHYTPDTGDALYRRSLYTFWRRIVAPTMFFDVAGRSVCAVKTPRTNTPLHALVTLNDTTYVEAARVLAQQLLETLPDASARVDHLFRLATARAPREDEKQVLLARLETLRAQFTSDPAAAEKLIAAGASPRKPDLAAPRLAAYATLCALVLNLDETLCKP